MAFYKDSSYLIQRFDASFDTLHSPGQTTPYSGIYRCQGCGHEITSVQNHPLPPQNHHQHIASQGTVRWRLIVKTTHSY